MYLKGQDLFKIDTIVSDNKTFYNILKDFIIKQFKPTEFHKFLVSFKEKILKVYSQNFDNLEFEAGLDIKLIKYVHGNIKSNFICIECKAKINFEEFKIELESKLKDGELSDIPRCGAVYRVSIYFEIF